MAGAHTTATTVATAAFIAAAALLAGYQLSTKLSARNLDASADENAAASGNDEDEALDREVDSDSDSDWDFESSKVKYADMYSYAHDDEDDSENEGDAAASKKDAAQAATSDSTATEEPQCYTEIEEVWDRSSYRYVRIKTSGKKNKSAATKAFYVHRRHVVTHGESDLRVNVRIELALMARILQALIPTEEKLYDSIPFVSARDLYAKIDAVEAWVAGNAQRAADARAASDSTEAAAVPTATAAASTSAEEKTVASATPAEFAEAHRAIAQLAKFLRTEFADLQAKYDRLIAQGLITYDLLWMLLHAGDMAWGNDAVYDRIQALRISRVRYVIPSASDQSPYFHVTGRTIEWSGTRFFPLTVQRAILKFGGTKPLAELALRPGAQMTPATRHHLITRGKMLEQYAGVQYVEYDGPLIWRQGHGCMQRIIKVPVTSRIMVDRASFERQNPDYDLKRPSTMESLDDAGIDVASGADGLALMGPFEDDEYLIMCPQFYGYAFGKKAWGEMLVEFIKPIQFAEHAYDQLVLDPATKDLVLGLVESHGKLHADLIQGKGRGLIFLLHGSPGQGKTLTAEVIAEHLQRPLISMGAGEMGTGPDKLEKRLQSLLTLAETWQAVLLLDEADVFMERRSTHEMYRNACVSIFLRLLERYQGILFLTTNRVGTFDEAFHSRLSLALRFADMDESARLVVWTQALDRLAASDSATAANWRDRINVSTMAHIPFNGRRINGIVRTAHALALRDKVVIDQTHFDTVIKRLQQFDKDVHLGVGDMSAGARRSSRRRKALRIGADDALLAEESSSESEDENVVEECIGGSCA
ncbi:hypothetical protein AMAG_13104 [Allomyces macrogynus ATCC 38327]|uniref:AAA+ ATPase domain-containing protein n=1 Tax=Allomyces macrogynus (strain ATCC 38327) TaxID=578462 RepID=A0A0L0T1F0_ALLM3|nr:hypothetical protein AMAG_13089 [Allomyces macrogynus ATCC 38327]KNE68453.1 hypothetical protein AMAG_13104 [Allomyces macrogynus ATCC 38327]|eukprot:KNE68434.1 hypothetical protein AMAG_13089 [Allomyces macrogynus ATCC 38327]